MSKDTAESTDSAEKKEGKQEVESNPESKSSLSSLTLNSKHRSLPTKFPWNGIKRLSIITGINGAGKTHLLQAINEQLSTDFNITFIEDAWSPDGNRKIFLTQIFQNVQELITHAEELKKAVKVIHSPEGYEYFMDILVHGNSYIDAGFKFDPNHHEWEFHNPSQEKVSGSLLSTIASCLNLAENKFLPDRIPEICDLFLKLKIEEIEQFLLARLNSQSTSIDNLLFTTLEKSISSIKVNLKHNGNNYHKATEQTLRSLNISKLPWEYLNQLFEKHNYNIRICEPNFDKEDYDMKFFNSTRSKDNHFSLESLSSGEKMVVNCFILIYLNNLTKSDPKPKLLLLDEPDSHLNPELIKLLMDIIENDILSNGTQVIMTSHRLDTISLAPKDSLFTMKHSADGSIEISPSHKTLAKFRLAKNLREFHAPIKVYTESFNDAEFYEAIHGFLLSKRGETRNEDGENKYQKHFIHSNRYIPQFNSTSILDGSSGGKSSVIDLTIKDLAARTKKRETVIDLTIKDIVARKKKRRGALSKFPIEMTNPFGLIDNDNGEAQDTLNKVLEKRGHGDESEKEGLRNQFMFLERYALENFIYDPFLLCSVFTKEELGEIGIKNEEILDELLKCKDSYEKIIKIDDGDRKVGGQRELLKNFERFLKIMVDQTIEHMSKKEDVPEAKKGEELDSGQQIRQAVMVDILRGYFDGNSNKREPVKKILGKNPELLNFEESKEGILSGKLREITEVSFNGDKPMIDVDKLQRLCEQSEFNVDRLSKSLSNSYQIKNQNKQNEIRDVLERHFRADHNYENLLTDLSRIQGFKGNEPRFSLDKFKEKCRENLQKARDKLKTKEQNKRRGEMVILLKKYYKNEKKASEDLEAMFKRDENKQLLFCENSPEDILLEKLKMIDGFKESEYNFNLFKNAYKIKLIQQKVIQTEEEEKKENKSRMPQEGNKLIKLFLKKDKTIEFEYPNSFLMMKGHDMERAIFKLDSEEQNVENDPLVKNAMDFIISKLHQSENICLPEDLVRTFDELDMRMRRQAWKVIKPEKLKESNDNFESKQNNRLPSPSLSTETSDTDSPELSEEDSGQNKEAITKLVLDQKRSKSSGSDKNSHEPSEQNFDPQIQEALLDKKQLEAIEEKKKIHDNIAKKTSQTSITQSSNPQKPIVTENYDNLLEADFINEDWSEEKDQEIKEAIIHVVKPSKNPTKPSGEQISQLLDQQKMQ